ncbi:MAG: diiron oxygenase [Acidobacteria bacterium]|nr:diiron oxygenase [Acidobacteriota bacterium]
MPTNRGERGHYEYKSRLSDWDSRAGVRAGVRRLLEEETAEKVYFSPALDPIIRHPLLVRLGKEAERSLLIYHLYSYLEFTASFEIEVVNRGAQRIAFGKSGLDLPSEMLFDAYKIYCDEAYHSLYSIDLKVQIEAATGIKPLPYNFGDFLRRFNKAREAVPPNLRPLSGLLFVIVFETLISSTLNKIPKDEQVVLAVRKMIADHANDEARHHAFFSSFMDVLWPQLSKRQKSILGPILPHFIIKALEPDYEAIKRRLKMYDLRPEEIDQIMAESYPWPEVIDGLRKTAGATLQLFRRNGLFEDPQTLEEFQKSGLII